MLKELLASNGISQAELARGISRSTAHVALLVNGRTGASQTTINSILGFLSRRLRRRVTYEETFGVVEVARR